METIRWGILGTGNIAHKFAQAILQAEGATLQAVASRTEAKAKDFANQYDINTAHSSYEMLAQNKDIDVVYIATPHGRHKEDAILCLEGGRHVLCEKAFALNLSELEDILAVAKREDRFIMEAIWTRFHPNFEQVMSLVEKDEIGEVKLIRADFGFYTPYDEASRLWNPALGGGSLLDIGIYPLFLALQLLGEPDEIQAFAHKTALGVDASMSMQLMYNNGASAQLYSSFEIDTEIEATVYGRDKRIIMHNRWHTPAPVSMWQRSTCLDRWEYPEVSGYVYEVLHVNECLRNNLRESPKLSHDFSRSLVRTMDSIRKLTGIEYSVDSKD
ncbi:MAG: Gfo/Idh/MocA family protein [Bacteroidia bacterium]